VAQLKGSTAVALFPATGPLAFDATRLAQFLDLQRGLLLSTADFETLPDRLVQAAAIFLGIPAAAVGVIEDARYRILATYGLHADYRTAHDATPLWDSALSPALVSGRSLVHREVVAGTELQTIALPFSAGDTTGVLHLVIPADRTVDDQDIQLGHALAVTAGVALANARQCRRLAQVARLKSDALASMAHDLRAPLNALVGYASLLREGAFGPLADEAREIAATLERQAIELVDLLGATLDVARLETDRLPVRCEEFSLADVLGSLRVSTFARAARDGVLAVHVPPDLPRLRTDRVKVKEIVQNLVDNALKHGAGGTVAVEATVAPERDTVRITVRDTGPGIDADAVAHLFEPFRPGAARTSGTGFGLYIVRCFAEALGGRVAARSRVGEGTAVTVELPLEAAGP